MANTAYNTVFPQRIVSDPWSARGISRKHIQQTHLHRLTASRPPFGLK
ncbi:hypothetical protein M5X11_21640 [Paenibacillus alginolyticus]|nr:hypothetical protein [Paenibacillus alginolyticus]MCY9667491.1 hypothetical protein [Paenibacillus alginolyticus]